MTGDAPRLRARAGGSVSHIATSLNMGGAQTMLVKLIEAEAACRTDVRHSVVSLLHPGVLAAGLGPTPVYSLGMKRGLPGPAAILRLMRISAHVRPDLLQGWMYHGNAAASVASLAQTRRPPVLWNVRHSLADLQNESRTTRTLLNLSARLSRTTAAILYNSHAAARQHEAIGFAAERSVVIPNGFDCRRFRPDPTRRAVLQELFGVPAEPIVVAMVARLHPMKDQAMLVDAVVRARKAGHDLHLMLAGTDLNAPPPALAARIAQLPDDRVTLIGERTDVADWLGGVDILALSSAWGEAFPNILGEAMACGIPCVATDVGDSAWIISDAGLIVPPRDAEAMAAALGQLAGDVNERHRRGAAGRARVTEHFEIEKIASRYRQLYLSIMRGETLQPRESGAILPSDQAALAR